MSLVGPWCKTPWSYTVMIDDRPVGALSGWRTGQYVVPEGHHIVRLRGSGSRNGFSADVAVDVEAGQAVRLRTWSRLRKLPFTWKGVVTFVLSPTGQAYLYPFGSDLDPFALWGNPLPWIVLGERPPRPGPVRFDATYDDTPEPSRQLSNQEAAIVETSRRQPSMQTATDTTPPTWTISFER